MEKEKCLKCESTNRHFQLEEKVLLVVGAFSVNVKTIAADADGSFAALRNTGLRGPHTDDIADLLLVGSPLITKCAAIGCRRVRGCTAPG